MASPNTLRPSGLQRFHKAFIERRIRDRRTHARALLDHPAAVFLLASGVLLGLTQWLQGHGYVDQNALAIWAKLLGLRDAQEARLEYLGFGFAHGPIFVSMLAGLLPGVATPLLPYQLAALWRWCA